MKETILQQGFRAQANSLTDFGYRDVTPEVVAAAHKKWISGEELSGIIERFCEGAFKDHPEIFGTLPA